MFKLKSSVFIFYIIPGDDLKTIGENFKANWELYIPYFFLEISPIFDKQLVTFLEQMRNYNYSIFVLDISPTFDAS